MVVSDRALEHVSASALDPQVEAAIVMSRRLAPLKAALGIENLTDQEMDLFAMVCQRTELDPFAKEIYAVKRQGKVTFQTGIDGFRTSAEKTREYRGSDEAEWGPVIAGGNGMPEHPEWALVVVHRQLPDGSWIHQSSGKIYFAEFYPNDAGSQFQWKKMPRVMLSKCAEAAAFRKGFPRRMSGVYVPEEMDQAASDTIEGTARPVGQTAAEKAQARLASVTGQATTSAASPPAAPAEAGVPPTPASAPSEPQEARPVASGEVEPGVEATAPSPAQPEVVEGEVREVPAERTDWSNDGFRQWLRDSFIGITDANKHIRATYGDVASIASITDEQRAATAAAIAHLAK